MAHLELERINVYRGDVQILWDVSMKVEAGEIVSMVGSNGAGKSTMLMAISGGIPCQSGSIRFLGQDIAALPPHRRVDLGLVQIPEGRRLFPFMTVFKNLEMGSFNASARNAKAASLDKVFQLFPILAERRTQLARTLSGGEQQMLAIGRALMAQPKLLMLDEPSLGLAPIIVKTIFATVHRINQVEAVTILLVEQNVKRCLQLSTRGYVLENGKIVLEGAGSALLENEHLRKAYLGL